MNARKQLAALAVRKTGNIKTGPVAVTYAGTASCPASCALRGSGCYYETGVYTRGINERLNKRARGKNVLEMARDEARAIDGLMRRGVPDGRAMRVHVGGDARTASAARVIAAAVARWRMRGGGRAWSYTHAWRNVPREAWGQVSVLASVESVEGAREALAAGYAPALVVDSFKAGKRAWNDGDLRVIPCPAQTHESIRCVDCRLCWDADKLHSMNAAIAFEAHGVGAKAARAAIADVPVSRLIRKGRAA